MQIDTSPVRRRRGYKSPYTGAFLGGSPQGGLQNMKHSYISLFYHIAWRTNTPLEMTPPTKKRMETYLKAVALKDNVELALLNISENCISMVFRLFGKHKLSNVISNIKSQSIPFIKSLQKNGSNFSWETGYNACTIHTSDLTHLRRQIGIKRLPLISPEIKHHLYDYIQTLAHRNEITILGIGGIHDHIHLLVNIPAACSLTNFVSNIKGRTISFVRKLSPGQHNLCWQHSYGAFTINPAHIPIVQKYIRNQEIHHQVFTFSTELKQFFQWSPKQCTIS